MGWQRRGKACSDSGNEKERMILRFCIAIAGIIDKNIISGDTMWFKLSEGQARCDA